MSVCVGVSEADCEADPLCVCDAVTLCVSLGVAEELRVDVGVAEGVGDCDCEPVEDWLASWVRVSEAV